MQWFAVTWIQLFACGAVFIHSAYTSSTDTSILGYLKGQKGQKGDLGIPGSCPNLCTGSCVPGARGILEIAEVNGRGVLNMERLRDVITKGNKTAMVLEAGLKSVSELTVEEANEVYVYLMFKNSVCDISLLSGSTLLKGEKGEKGEPGEKGQKGEKGELGEKGQKGEKGCPGDPGMAAAAGSSATLSAVATLSAGTVGLEAKGDMGPVELAVSGPMGHEEVVGPPGQPEPEGVKGSKGDMEDSGEAFTIWGQPICPSHASLLYEGKVAQIGGSLQCLQQPFQPVQLTVPTTYTAPLRTVFYTSKSYTVQAIECALCYVPSRTSQFVSIGAQLCPTSWSTEYAGALATSVLEPSNTICVTQSFLEQKLSWESRNDISLVEGQVSCALCTR